MVLSLLEKLGQAIVTFFAYFGELGLLHLEVLRGIFTGRGEMPEIFKQMARVGADSLPVAAGSLIVSGAVLAYHGAVQAGQFGVARYAGYFVSEVMAREAAPALVAFVVAARAGSAITAEIGTMKVTEQIDALRTMATSPVHYLVIPRYVASVIMIPILSFLGILLGVLGGYLISFMMPQLNPITYFTAIPGRLGLETVLGGILKATIFGMIVALSSCYEGLSCGMASEEVGRATTRGVVRAIVLCYITDIIVAPILFWT